MTPVTENINLSEFGPDQWSDIYKQFARPIYYLILRMLGNASQAEDATHDVFLKAYRARDQFKGKSNIKSWLYQIAINHCRTTMQNWHSRNMVSNADDVLVMASTPAEKPLRGLMLKELGQRIKRTLDTLPTEYRLLLLLIADEELSYDEVARLTNQAVDAVRGKLYRARKAFAIEFNKQEG
jgi:RNA polymerase sigma-70 factor, ECF subfamily